ncbi:polysaccharide pyruvyl transferase family protein [Actinospongicola halichondriae]|uniref:polysaccharide pyruvyl transferase family protein n=1 Tax=Actinospongicola halichondriae TaxID=3236844 RepID=UPI003D569C1E
MRVFVTGLCLQGNKGGPALAVSLRAQLEREFGHCDLTLSVPSRDIERERAWAEHYGVEVVPDFVLADVVPPYMFRDFSSRRARVGTWFRALRRADVLVELSAISYVGPPVGSTRSAMTHRFRYFVACRIARRRFVAWTQSYGPFTTWPVRAMARLDLSRQDIVFCRGDDCRDDVSSLLPRARAESFPDVATTMGFDVGRGAELLEAVGVHPGDVVVTLSPSAVLYAKSDGVGVANQHVRQMREMVDKQVAAGRRVGLVPHTLRPDRPDPLVCDGAVCGLILADTGPDVVYLDADLAAPDLKSVIANATVHVGGRYHSIIAALSSGVPCLSLSWHPKYLDIMRMYGMEDFVIDGLGATTQRDVLIERLVNERPQLSEQLLDRQPAVAAEVERNAALFAGMIRQ